MEKIPIKGVFVASVGRLGPELIRIEPMELENTFSHEDSINLAIRTFPVSGVEGDFSVFLFKKKIPVTSYLFSIKRTGKRNKICSLSVILKTTNYNPFNVYIPSKTLIEKLSEVSYLTVDNVAEIVPTFYEVLIDYSSDAPEEFPWNQEIKRMIKKLNGNKKVSEST